MPPPRMLPPINPTTRSIARPPKRKIDKEKKNEKRMAKLSQSDPSRILPTGSRMSLSAAARRRSTLAASSPTGRSLDISVSRLPSLSLSPAKRPTENVAKLERVVGCTSLSQTSLAVEQRSGTIAYLAGASVVVNRGRRYKENHLVGPSRNTFSTLAFSPCGQVIATGEFGHSPCVRLFELMDKTTDKFVGAQTKELSAHTFGIVAVKFSPVNNQLISVGEHHDQMIVVWNWKTGEQIASSKVTAQVNAVAISADGSQCVSVGLRHVKYWSIGEIKGRGITGRSAILNDFRNSLFVDVAFMGEKRVIAVTEKGMIAELVDKKIMRTFHLENSKIFAVCVMGSRLLVGCNNGSVQSVDFSCTDLTLRPSLCLPHFLSQDVALATTVEELQNKPNGAKFADVHAISCQPSTSTVTVAYADHSIYSWQEGEEGGCKKIHSALAHVGNIHALEIYPSDAPYLPAGSFLTGGADGTLRLWNIHHGGTSTGGTPMKNLLSNDLKKMLILDDQAGLVAAKNSTMVPTNERFDNGIKSVRVSRDGRHCAVGMRNGTLLILDLTTPSMDMITSVDAQEGDIMCLEYSTPSNEAPFLLACGGRDRLVHIFRPDDDYSHVCTIEDHSSAVVAIRFVSSSDGFMMYTCAADKMIIIWRLVTTDPSSLSFERVNQISSLSASISDLHVSIDGLSLLAACADRQLRKYSLTGKLLSTVKATTDAGTVGSSSCTRMAIDHSGTFVASICSDRFVYIVEAKSGNPVAVLRGFGDMATAISFSNDQKRLIVASSNGCIYVFRLSERLINRITAARKLLIDARTPSPDSLLGSGSETVSDDQPKDSEVDSSHFGSVNSLAIDDDTESGVGSNSSVVVSGRRDDGDTINISIRDSSTFAIEEPEGAETAEKSSPRYQSSKSMSNIRSQMVSSAFMDENRTGASSPRRTRRKWGESTERHEENDDSSPFSSSLDGGMKLAPSTLPSNFHPQSRLGAVIRQMEPSSTPSNPTSSALLRPTPYSFVSSPAPFPPSAPLATPSPTSRLRENLLARKQAEQLNGSTLQSPPPSLPPPSNGFSRESPERVSLSKRYQLKSAVKEPPRTAWSPSASSTSSSSSSRRTTSSIGLSNSPAGASAAAITRRQSDLFGKGNINGGFHSPFVNQMEGNPSEVKSMRRSRTMGGGGETRTPSRGRREEDDSFSALRQHIRSRSQSPNQLLMNGILATSTPNGMNTRGYERKDSESSYPLSTRRTPSRSNLRGGEELRKSSQALDKIAQTRKLRQSTENLAGDLDSSPISRARSIGNLRGGGQLEIGGGFDVDEARPRLSSPLTRMSRNLARSMGQLNGENAIEGGAGPSPRMAPSSSGLSSGLLGAMSQLKKASNPDLADERLYEEREDFTSPILKPRRGAVQKKVDRFRPNRGVGSRMESGSGESDSNASDASPLHTTYQRKESLSNRPLDGLRVGRRLGDSPRLTASPSTATRRVPNYISQKMQPQELEGPDLGSDESPRSSIMNGNIHHDWMGQFEGKPDEIKKVAHHLLQCQDEIAMAMTKMMHAKQIIREMEGMDEDDRATLLDVANNSVDVWTTKLRGERMNGMEREKERMHPTNGINPQTRLSSASSQSSSFSSSNLDSNAFVRQYGPDLVALLRNNMAKQN